MGVLYVKESDPHPPDWVSFLLPGLDVTADELGLVNAGSSAVVVAQRDDRVYAIAFGYGRFMLNDEALDQRFGLRCTLNAIDPSQIRSLDRKTFERVQRHTREQVSQASSLAAFEVDVEQDLLRSVTGTPEDDSLAHRFTGRDALTAAVRATIDDVPALLDRYGALQSEDTYKENFAWVDHIAEVSDPALKEDLFKSLLSNVRHGELDRVWLAPPEILEWARIEGFSYKNTKSANLFSDLDLEEYLDEVGRGDSLSMKHLSTDHIYCITAAGEVQGPSWTLRRTLCGEIEYKDGRYALDEGTWYRIDQDFAERVESAVSDIDESSVSLPPYEHDSEPDYNQVVGDDAENDLFVLDGNLINTRTAHGRVELCDLLAPEKVLIHVKRYGGSSVLSHLFNQGFVSAQLLLRDRTFRTSANDILPEPCKFADPTDPIEPSDFEISYAIVAPENRDLRLPFFSMVSFRNIHRNLQEMGFRVSLSQIDNAA